MCVCVSVCVLWVWMCWACVCTCVWACVQLPQSSHVSPVWSCHWWSSVLWGNRCGLIAHGEKCLQGSLSPGNWELCGSIHGKGRKTGGTQVCWEPEPAAWFTQAVPTGRMGGGRQTWGGREDGRAWPTPAVRAISNGKQGFFTGSQTTCGCQMQSCCPHRGNGCCGWLGRC